MRIKTFQKYTSRKFWRNKTVLITGINGFVGGNLAKHLLSCGATIIGITNSNKKNKFLKFENIIDKIKLHTVDIKNYDKLSKIFSLYKIDICFHLAAQVDVNIARLNPYNTFENIKVVKAAPFCPQGAGYAKKPQVGSGSLPAYSHWRSVGSQATTPYS